MPTGGPSERWQRRTPAGAVVQRREAYLRVGGGGGDAAGADEEGGTAEIGTRTERLLCDTGSAEHDAFPLPYDDAWPLRLRAGERAERAAGGAPFWAALAFDGAAYYWHCLLLAMLTVGTAYCWHCLLWH